MNIKKLSKKHAIANQPLVWTALVTPLFNNDEIDYPSLRRLVLQQNDAKNGILLLGSTGEGLALSSQEHLSIVEFVCSITLRVPVMVAVGGYNLTEQLAWVAKCNTLAIDAYLLASPIYAKPGPKGQLAWFKRILDAANLPCMLYNVPSRTGVEIAISTLQALQNHKNCWALKEASGELNKLLAYRQHCPEVEIFSGEDAMMPFLAAANVKGLVSVCSNVWPEATKHYVTLALSQQQHDLFELWHPAISALFQVTSPIPVKTLLAELEVISSAKLRLPLCQSEISTEHGLQDIHQKIQRWFSQQQARPVALDPSSLNPTLALLANTNLREVNS